MAGMARPTKNRGMDGRDVLGSACAGKLHSLQTWEIKREKAKNVNNIVDAWGKAPPYLLCLAERWHPVWREGRRVRFGEFVGYRSE